MKRAIKYFVPDTIVIQLFYRKFKKKKLDFFILIEGKNY